MSGVHVYLITELSEAPQAFKIGISANPDARVNDLNAGNPRALYVAYRSPPFTRAEALDMERGAHEDLAHWSLGREWFYCPIEYGLDALRSVGAMA